MKVLKRIFRLVLFFFLCGAADSSASAKTVEGGNDMPTPAIDFAAERGRILEGKDAVIQKGPFSAEWGSLKQYRTPEWFQDAKLGIFIHWGLYSVPAYAHEWYPRHMYEKGHDINRHHVAAFGETAKFGLKDFIPLFRAEKYDPAAWAGLFKKAGAKYVVPVFEHHDGFALYDSGLSRWTAVKMGPKRDVYKELSAALRKEGLVFGLSTHRAEHWWFMNFGMKSDSDVQDKAYADFYGPAQPDGTQPDTAFLEDWEARTLELIDEYRPQVLYFDWWIEQPAFEPYRRNVAAYYYDRAAEWGKGVVLNYKNGAYPKGAAVYDVERGTLPGIRTLPWQTCTSVGWKSWGYVENESYKDPNALIRDFIDIVSKNGCLLLNVGPRPDGTIPQEAQNILLKIGEWLRVNGEAIYGTRPWVAYGEGPNRAKGGGFSEGKVTYAEGDVRFTRKGNALYILPLLCPTKPLTITLLGEKLAPGVTVKNVTLLGAKDKVKWERNADGLLLQPPGKTVKQAVAYKALLDGSHLGGIGIEADGYDLTAEAVLQNYGVKPVSRDVSLEVGEKVLATASLTAAAQESVTFELKGNVTEGGVARISLTEKGKEFFGRNQSLPNIRLDGEWLFAKGDKDGWRKQDFDDSAWQKVKLPDKWENHSGYHGDNVYGWYRKNVSIPAEWKGKTLILPLGKIDDCDVSYFNGKEIGRTGQMPPDYVSAYDKERRYEVPPEWVKWGGENVIAVRVYDTTGGGGIVDGPLGPVELK